MAAWIALRIQHDFGKVGVGIPPNPESMTADEHLPGRPKEKVSSSASEQFLAFRRVSEKRQHVTCRHPRYAERS